MCHMSPCDLPAFDSSLLFTFRQLIKEELVGITAPSPFTSVRIVCVTAGAQPKQAKKAPGAFGTVVIKATLCKATPCLLLWTSTCCVWARKAHKIKYITELLRP